MEEDEITISKDMLKAIGADTRIAILKSLLARQKTQSELAAEMKLSSPTVMEHIEQLQKAGLIELVQQDIERKWKYYKLTKVGRKMVGGNKMTVMVLLSTTLLVALSVLYLFFVLQPVNPKIIQSSAPGAIQNAMLPLSKVQQAETTAQPLSDSNVIKKGIFTYGEINFDGYNLTKIDYDSSNKKEATFCKDIMCNESNSFSMLEGETKKSANVCMHIYQISISTQENSSINATLYKC